MLPAPIRCTTSRQRPGSCGRVPRGVDRAAPAERYRLADAHPRGEQRPQVGRRLLVPRPEAAKRPGEEHEIGRGRLHHAARPIRSPGLTFGSNFWK